MLDGFRYWIGRTLRRLATRIEPKPISFDNPNDALAYLSSGEVSSGGGTITLSGLTTTWPISFDNPHR